VSAARGVTRGVVAPLAVQTVAPRRVSADTIRVLLDSPEVAELIAGLDDLRLGRKGYGSRALVGATLIKSLYVISTWTRVASLIAEHDALQAALGGAPSQWACYRFTVKLRQQKPLLDACLDRILAALHDELPELGRDVAIDGSDLPAYANGQRHIYAGGPYRPNFSDPDASWGHRSAISTRSAGSFYGYKIHAAFCTKTELPLAWEIHPARDAEATVAEPLLDRLSARGFQPQTAVLDKGYDVTPVYDACERAGALPVIPLRQTPAVKQGKHLPPECEHGIWKFAGADAKRKRTKWRCPTGDCAPFSTWVKADRLHTLIPRESKRWRELYRGRGAVERGFGRLKIDHGLTPLRVRGLERVALHADLCILTTLAAALARARRAVPLAA
jgi:hypothetical protein